MPVRFGQKTTKQVIDQVASNDPTLTSLELIKNASFCMKSTQNTVALSEALSKNTIIKTVVLRECEIVDSGAEAIAAALEVNTTLEDLDLQQNHMTTAGVIRLAHGIARNKTLKTLNLLGQAQKVLGEDCVEAFISMFEYNITLTKLMWKVDSRRTWEISKLITRNVEIQKLTAAGGDYSHLLPTKLRAPSSTDVSPTVSGSVPVAEPVPAPVPSAEPVVPAPTKSESLPAPAPAPAPAALPVVEPPAEPATEPVDDVPSVAAGKEVEEEETSAPVEAATTEEVASENVPTAVAPPEQEPPAEEEPPADEQEADGNVEEVVKEQDGQLEKASEVQAEVQKEVEAAVAGGTGNAPANDDGSESMVPDSPGGTALRA